MTMTSMSASSVTSGNMGLACRLLQQSSAEGQRTHAHAPSMATANDSMVASQVEHVLAHLNSHQQLLAACDEAWSRLYSPTSPQSARTTPAAHLWQKTSTRALRHESADIRNMLLWICRHVNYRNMQTNIK
jgi:hypothetical protein